MKCDNRTDFPKSGHIIIEQSVLRVCTIYVIERVALHVCLNFPYKLNFKVNLSLCGCSYTFTIVLIHWPGSAVSGESN